MRDAITTLPISPVTTPHLGLGLIPLLMEFIGSGLGLTKILALNIQGLKHNPNSPQSEKVQVAHSFTESLEHLGVHPQYLWRDDLNDFAAFAQSALTYLLEKGRLKIETRHIVKCPCGKVEFLLGAENFSHRRRLFREGTSGKICILCNGALHTEQAEVCLFVYGAGAEHFVAMPQFAQQELRSLAVKFSGIECLVSRTRVTHFSLNLPGLRDFDIDPDFLWALMIPYLHTQEYAVRYVVASQRNLLACFLLGTLGHIFASTMHTTFIVPAYITGPKQSNVKTFGSIDELVARHGQYAVQAFLVQGLNWTQKESVVDPGHFKHLTTKSADILEQGIQSVLPATPDDIVELRGHSLRKVLARLSKP